MSFGKTITRCLMPGGLGFLQSPWCSLGGIAQGAGRNRSTVRAGDTIRIFAVSWVRSAPALGYTARHHGINWTLSFDEAGFRGCVRSCAHSMEAYPRAAFAAMTNHWLSI